jgi:hypothetical protein
MTHLLFGGRELSEAADAHSVCICWGKKKIAETTTEHSEFPFVYKCLEGKKKGGERIEFEVTENY